MTPETLIPVGTGGLTSEEAAHRLRLRGPNRLRPEIPYTRLLEFLKTLFDPMAVMLILAAGTYFLLGETRDGIILLIALIPVLGVDVVLEYRSREALRKLNESLAPQCRVLRDGVEKEVPAEELVPGDLLILKEGDKALADGVFRHCANLSMDESQLTGESEPVFKSPYHEGHEVKNGSKTKDGDLLGELGGEKDLGLNPKYFFFAGSLVTTGQARGEVLRTGLNTRFGQIAKLVAEEESEETPLQRKTNRLVRRLGYAGFGVVGVVLALQILRGLSFPNAFLSAVSLGIAAFPEEFPLVFTLFLSLGAWRLSRHGVLVKRLTSVETLGSTTVICVDKTGTLTQGVFALESHLPLFPSVTEGQVLEASVLACELFPADPMEKAIWAHAKDHGIDIPELERRWKLVHDYDFDPVGKHMSHAWRRGDGACRVVAKGALEGVLEHCDIAPAERERVEKENEKLASQGFRVLAVASRDTPALAGKREEDEKGLKLLGLLAFRDPIRPEIPHAVELCQKAGIRIKLITGDHLLTAHAVADAVGIAHEPQDLLNAGDLDGLSPVEFAARVRQGSVFARVRPEQKHAIVEALRKAGEVVAMTGDGINDAPALKKADIGIAMGLKGTDVARASADMVLLGDSFESIEKTIFEGRRIFVNIQRAFYFLLAFHIPIVLGALLCPLLGLPLLYMPVHLVWFELIVHPVSALLFEGEPAPPDMMQKPPRDPQAELLPMGQVWVSLITGTFLTAAVMSMFLLHLSQGLVYARSTGMAALILGSLVLVWAERAVDKAWWRMPFPRTRRFWTVWLAVALSLPAIMEIHWLESVFQVTRISLSDWGLAALLPFTAIGWRMFGISRSRQ
jgi:Ca2+-transporting ATPase